jgi:NADH dehydrogenase
MKQHILVIGAGFGGMWTALSATRLFDIHGHNDVEVTVLAPQAELRVRPRFYEPNAHQLAAPIGELFDAVGVHFIKGSAETIDVEQKRVGYLDASGNQQVCSYDKLVLATGSRLALPNTPGVAEHAFDVDQIEQAVRLENHLKSLVNLPESKARNTVVVAGGGFTGIETATEMPARLRAILGDRADIEVIIVDRGEKVGGSMGAEIAKSIAEASIETGVKWRLKSSVRWSTHRCQNCRLDHRCARKLVDRADSGRTRSPGPSARRRALESDGSGRHLRHRRRGLRRQR